MDRTGGLTLACCGPPGSLEAASRAGGSSSPAPMQLLVAAAKALLSVSAAAAGQAAGCRPAAITDSDNAGCGRYFPRYHPKNAMPLAHNNDANAPFVYKGVYHIFMQATFPGVPGWNGAIGLAHLASRDLSSWKVLPAALLPGRWGGPPGPVGQPAGNATGGYYSGSATLVNGMPRIVVPAVWGSDHPKPGDAGHSGGTGPGGAGNCNWMAMGNLSHCLMNYIMSEPTDLSDPWLVDWSEPITIVDSRVDGVQPHGPGFDDVTHGPPPAFPSRLFCPLLEAIMQQCCTVMPLARGPTRHSGPPFCFLSSPPRSVAGRE